MSGAGWMSWFHGRLHTWVCRPTVEDRPLESRLRGEVADGFRVFIGRSYEDIER